MNQTAFISEYSRVIDEKHTHQKNDKNQGRESGIGILKTIISVTRIGGESHDGSLAGVGDTWTNRERGGNLEFPIGVNRLIGWSTEGEKDGVRKRTNKNVMRNQTMAVFISGHDENHIISEVSVQSQKQQPETQLRLL